MTLRLSPMFHFSLHDWRKIFEPDNVREQIEAIT